MTPPPSSESTWVPDPWDDVDVVDSGATVRSEGRLIKFVVFGTLALFAGAVLALGALGLWYLDRVRPDGDAGGPLAFTVAEGDTVERVIHRLVDEGFVVDGELFAWYVDKQGGLKITPGYYQLPQNAHMGDVLGRLRTPPDQTYQRVTFPEGFTIEQMGERLENRIPRLSADVFVAAANLASVDAQYRNPDQPSLEGLLFPDTYQISNADNEGQVVERMVGIMERVAGQEGLAEGADRLGFTPYQILIVASMIEKEAKLDVDRPKIARVIYNRLERDMLLQIDATLYYQGDRDVPFSQLRQVDGPYNSYQRKGLPPTPISNPGRASIAAALNPAPNPPAGDPVCQVLADPTTGCEYIYYVLADDEGGHAFSVTLEQHEANIRKARAAGLL